MSCRRSVHEGRSGIGRGALDDSPRLVHDVGLDLEAERDRAVGLGLEWGAVQGWEQGVGLDQELGAGHGQDRAVDRHGVLARHGRLRGRCHSPVHAFPVCAEAVCRQEPSRGAVPEAH